MRSSPNLKEEEGIYIIPIPGFLTKTHQNDPTLANFILVSEQF